MIIWKGKGFVIALVAFFSLLVTEVIVEYLYTDRAYYQNYGWPKLVGFWMAAIITYVLSLTVLKSRRRIVVDNETGEKISLINTHSLFFVDIKYVSIVLFVLGIIFLFIHD